MRGRDKRPLRRGVPTPVAYPLERRRGRSRPGVVAHLPGIVQDAGPPDLKVFLHLGL